MNGVGFKILARTAAPQLGESPMFWFNFNIRLVDLSSFGVQIFKLSRVQYEVLKYLPPTSIFLLTAVFTLNIQTDRSEQTV